MTTEARKPTAEEQWQQVQAGGISTAQDILELYQEVQAEGTRDERIEKIQQQVQEWPLSVDVRSTSWVSVGAEMEADEFRILLSTGGPSMRITGDIGQHGEPCNPLMQVQDWFKPWTTCDTTEEQDEALLWFCSEFYFGEGFGEVEE